MPVERLRRLLLPRWSELRRVGNAPSVRLTVLIPLVGYLVIFNANVVSYLQLAKEVMGAQPEHDGVVSPRLLLVYFGLCALALASAIYGRYCPGEVKHYGTSAAYVGGDGPNIGDFAFEPIEMTLRDSPSHKQRYERIVERFHRRSIVAQSREDELESRSQSNNALLHLYFDFLNILHPFWRGVAGALFKVGLLCLLVPSAEVFWRVLLILWKATPGYLGSLWSALW